ncbi:MAG: hypothetical protein WBO10_00380 [Pyrinomonadaceae bacterium]
MKRRRVSAGSGFWRLPNFGQGIGLVGIAVARNLSLEVDRPRGVEKAKTETPRHNRHAAAGTDTQRRAVVRVAILCRLFEVCKRSNAMALTVEPGEHIFARLHREE